MSGGLPTGLGAAIEEALARLGTPGSVVRAEPLGGGCINHASRLTTEQGESFFLKWNARAARGLFTAEANGLAALASARALRVPAVIACAEAEAGTPAWLLLEYVAPGSPAAGYAVRLGEGLVQLHRSGCRGGVQDTHNARACGWERDNFIGSLPQSNAPADTWGEFWRDRRLAPQLELVCARGHFRGREGHVLDRVLARTGALLADVEAEAAGLLHGDFWSGNAYADGDGEPVLIDPAVYRGHREVDLAMSELFGGFPRGWPRAYEDAWPLRSGYDAFRRALYQLYYLLVHVNLFGSRYEASCVAAAHRVVAAD